MNRRSLRRNDHDREALNREVRAAVIQQRITAVLGVLLTLGALTFAAKALWPDAFALLFGF